MKNAWPGEWRHARLKARGQAIDKVYGNLTGLGAEQIRRLSLLYRRRIPTELIIPHDLARSLTALSREINRQVGVLISRRGEIAYVIAGSHREIMIPSLDGFRSSSTRFKGLRLIHTHLNNEGLTADDLTDLALLRLDLVCAVEAGEDGLPGYAHTAHLIPENPDGEYWSLMEASRPSEMHLNFTAFIQALESEFAKKQKTRKVDSSDRAILIRVETNPLSDSQASLDELKELARSCGVEVFDTVIQYREQLDPRFILGRGKISELVIRALQIGANLLIFDHEMTPAQIRSITDFTEMKVIDRTQVILDIFARRAHSREGKLQVELAQLKYLLPRLATKNTAMSRLTGGIGGRGPGETKLEINRRRVRDRIHRLERDLQDIEKARAQRRGKRERMGLPIISIVGYTNAGKSTLLNTLTKSNVFTEDRLFATLDPKSSRLRFPRDTEAIITDTVGFIRDLPRDLFAAFRATLDELQEADALLHVIDISNPIFESHIAAVEKILEDLGIIGKPTIRVFNKEDRLPDKTLIKTLCRRFGAIAVSALHQETLRPLIEKMETLVSKIQNTRNYSFG
ncbi:MAG: GTPase HflX [Deltaproteobacteria bacterium]|nr:GTPase HflX [Deltaproteobacteria bacterium]